MSDSVEVNNSQALPLLSLNHVSLLCRSVRDSMRFYEQVLGFVPIKRPSSFKFNGAWLYNYGIGIHLIQHPSIDDFDNIVEPRPINPKDNHISFQCTDVGLVLRRLEDMGMKYVTAVVEDEGNKVEQVFFHDPDGYMVELCNCENIPVVPLSSCSFKPRLSSFIKSAPAKCGFTRHSHVITMAQRGGAHQQRPSAAPLKQSHPSILRTPMIRKPSDRTTSSNGSSLDCPNPASTSRAAAASACTELDLFLEMLPMRMRGELSGHGEIGELIEVVMDLGRKPLARFPSGDWVISDQPVKHEDLLHSTSKVGDFSDDNRSGIDRCLHRISAIRNRKLQIIGLTCRVGRAVSGSAEIIRDLVEGGGSILVIGPPGVGKTTLIREIARMLADEHMKRVVIVDTSNEIGGDGDVPHEGIGRARRMQVPNVNMQHNVMIEAVENHMPETIIIDEIGTELEALAASTIAQRGVQLVGTAHGMTIDNIIKNPSLQLLVGGIESVTLGDEEARKRKVQKTILERKGPSTFTCAVEMISKTECRVHHRLDATVDAILAGKSPSFEIRQMEHEANVPIKSTVMTKIDHHELSDKLFNENTSPDADYDEEDEQSGLLVNEEKRAEVDFGDEDEYDLPIAKKKQRFTGSTSTRSSPIFVYTYKILEADLLQVATVMGLEDEIDVTDDIGMADAILASASEIKQNPWIRGIAKFHKLPMFVIKSNTMAQMVKAVRMILERGSHISRSGLVNRNSSDIEIEDDAPKRKPTLEEIDALEEVRLAIEYIVIPGGEPVELLPRRSEIIARQLELVKSYQLDAENSGTELNPRLQILPHRLNKRLAPRTLKTTSDLQNETGSKPLTDSSGGTSVTRLPFLPE